MKLLILMLLFLAAPAMAEDLLALQIIQPRAGLTTTNRYYKAYPGLLYEVQISVLGGVFSFYYEIVSAPSGVSIDNDKGILSWSSPSEGSESITVKVTDAVGTSDFVTWPITVTENGFIFMDKVDGKTVASGGTGTKLNPFKDMNDWYLGDKTDDTYAGYFLYWHTGAYSTFGGGLPQEDGKRLAFTVYRKPLVWLAYPGDSPAIDVDRSKIIFYSGSDNLYIDGLEFHNYTQKQAVKANTGLQNMVIRKCYFHDLPDDGGGVGHDCVTGSNCAAIYLNQGGGRGQYNTVVDNRFADLHDIGYVGLLAYDASNLVYERNSHTGINNKDSLALGIKRDNSNWSVRNNRFDLVRVSRAIYWSGNANCASNDPPKCASNLEFSYNLIQVGTGRSIEGHLNNYDFGPMLSKRNTHVIDDGFVHVENLTSGRGPVEFRNDVIVTNSAFTNGVKDESGAGLIVFSDVLSGNAADNIVDAGGNLIDRSLVGTYGYEAGGAPVIPVPTETEGAVFTGVSFE